MIDHDKDPLKEIYNEDQWSIRFTISKNSLLLSIWKGLLGLLSFFQIFIYLYFTVFGFVFNYKDFASLFSDFKGNEANNLTIILIGSAEVLFCMEIITNAML